MNFNIIFAVVTMVLILLAVFLEGRALERLFYIFIMNFMVIILMNKGVPLALLFGGTVIPLFTRNKLTQHIAKNKKGSSKSIKEKIINYLSFAPLIGIGVMSYRLPQAEVGNLSPLMIILGEVSLIVITFLVIIPKRIKLK